VPPPIRRTVAVKVQFGDADVRSWELGLRPGEEISDDENDGLPGFSVDGGLGCLMDVADLGYLRHLQRDAYDELDSILEAIGPDGAEIVPVPESSGSVFVFACGMGDGVYPTWIGRDSEGQAVSLVIDLELLSHSLGIVD
jgi:hypothetical protein